MPETPTSTLDGRLIIDLSRVLGGPWCTQILGDHGAEVIKIEPPRGDETRDWGPPFHKEDAAYFIGVNRNKRSMGLDLSRESGRAVLLNLLQRADVLVENYRPGTMEKWGLGYEETLAPRFPGLVHCRVSGFGSDGPWGGFPGYDAIVQAMAGWFSVNGEAGGTPTRLGLAMVDMGTGLYAAIAILMALLEREHSGRGQYLDMTLYDCALSLMHPHVVNYCYSAQVPGLAGNAHPNISPYDTFYVGGGQASDDHVGGDHGGSEIFIGAGNDRAFARLCAELGCPELVTDPRFRHNKDRVRHRTELKTQLEAALRGHDAAEVCERLARAGLAAGPIRDTAQVVDCPHSRHRQMVVENGWYKMTGTPLKFSRTPGEPLRRRPPAYGRHSREILAEFGYTPAAIESLLQEGTVLEKRQQTGEKPANGAKSGKISKKSL